MPGEQDAADAEQGPRGLGRDRRGLLFGLVNSFTPSDSMFTGLRLERHRGRRGCRRRGRRRNEAEVPVVLAERQELLHAAAMEPRGRASCPPEGRHQAPLPARMPDAEGVVNAFATFKAMAAVRRVLIRKAGPT